MIRKEYLQKQILELDALIREGEAYESESNEIGLRLTLDSLRSYRKELVKRLLEGDDWIIDSG